MRAPLPHPMDGTSYRARQLVAGTNLANGRRGDGTAISSCPPAAACPTAANATSSAATSTSSGFPRTTRTAGAATAARCSPRTPTASRSAASATAAARRSSGAGADSSPAASRDASAGFVLAESAYPAVTAHRSPCVPAAWRTPSGTPPGSPRAPDSPTEARTSNPAPAVITSPTPDRIPGTPITSAGSRACAPEPRRAWPATSPATGSASPASGRARSRRRPGRVQPRSTGASARSCTP